MDITYESGPLRWTQREKDCGCETRIVFCDEDHAWRAEGVPMVAYNECYDCRMAAEEKKRQQREKIDRRHYELLLSGVDPKSILAVPQGAISPKILSEMGIIACPGYRTGENCSGKSHPCTGAVILWENDCIREQRCPDCKEKHTWRYTGCDIWCRCKGV